MFKHLLRVRIGGWWLLAGVWLKWRMPLYQFQDYWWDYREYSIRVFWLEVSISELPF